MNEFKVEDVVIVYKDTPTFKDGAVAQIIDKDPNDGSYAVADLRDVGKADRDIQKLLTRYVKWVDPTNMSKIEFKKVEVTNKKPFILTLIVITTISLLLSIYLL
jgi:hypothetical protein